MKVFQKKSSARFFLLTLFCSLFFFAQSGWSETAPSAGPFPNAPLASPAVDAATGKPITLSVNGAQIVNQNSEPIILKGVNRPSMEWNAQGQYLSAQDLQTMHEKWNVNVVRIPLNQGFWFASAPVTQSGSYKQIINAMIYYATQNNMAVILDLHWADGSGQTGQTPMANQQSLQFWSEVATTYQNFGTVIFELFNEPYGIDQNTWLNGNATYAGYQQLYNAVRATGANNICIINGLDWAYDLSFVNENFHVAGTNIVYGSHPYDKKPWNQNNGFATNFQGILGKYPLIFTEFGDNQSADYANGSNAYAAIYQEVLNFCNKNNVSYTAWAWWVENGNPAFPTLIQDWSGTPLNGGVFVHEDLQTNPGTAFDFGSN